MQYQITENQIQIMLESSKTITAIMLIIAIIYATGCKKNNEPNNGTYNGHDYVDLGLPSGTLWATCNVGADNPEDYGDYFAWGETQPKITYDWSTYQYCNGDYNQLTKYCSQSDFGIDGFTDNLKTLLEDDDAATANWGEGWRTPTSKEWSELLTRCTPTSTTINGMKGCLLTARNGNSIFLPAASRRDDESRNLGDDGSYWSSSINNNYPDNAKGFNFILSWNDYDLYDDLSRYVGRSVRAVRSSQ